MVQDIEDILEELGPLYQCQAELAVGAEDMVRSAIQLNPMAKRVLGLVGSESITVDEIVQHSDISVSAVLSAPPDVIRMPL